VQDDDCRQNKSKPDLLRLVPKDSLTNDCPGPAAKQCELMQRSFRDAPGASLRATLIYAVSDKTDDACRRNDRQVDRQK